MAKDDKFENIENPELDVIEDDVLDEVTGGRGFAMTGEAVIGSDNKIV